MANNSYVNKVETADGSVIMDITNDTATPSDVLNGATFHDRSGAPQTGNLITHNVYDGLDSSSSSDALSANQGRVLNTSLSKLIITTKTPLVNSSISASGDTSWHSVSGTFDYTYKRYVFRIGLTGALYDTSILDKQDLDLFLSGNEFRSSVYWNENNLGQIAIYNNTYSITAKCKDFAFSYSIYGEN